jgi:hypothetical protein
MNIDHIAIRSGSHPEKMRLEATYPDLLNAHKAINLILQTCQKVFSHDFTQITFYFDDGYVGKVSFRTCEGLNGHYYVADLLDELIEFCDDQLQRGYLINTGLHERLIVLKDEIDRHYDDLYEKSSEQPSRFEDSSFLMQMNPIHSGHCVEYSRT